MPYVVIEKPHRHVLHRVRKPLAERPQRIVQQGPSRGLPQPLGLHLGSRTQGMSPPGFALQCDRGASATKAACEDEPPASANSRARTWLSSTALRRPRSHQNAPPTRTNGMTVINAVINSKAMRVSSSLPVVQTEHAAAIPGVNRTPQAISSHTMREDRLLIVGTPRGKARAILPRQRTRTLLPRQTGWA